MNCDVLVVGAGAAGVAAACGAADAGQSVVLVERSARIGGMATGAEVGTLCGLHLRGPSRRWAMGGFPRAFGERVEALAGPATGWRDDLWFLPCPPAVFESVAESFLDEAGVTTLRNTTVTGMSAGAGPRVVSLWTWDRPATITARAVVDASGLALGSRLLGLPQLSYEPQSAAIVFSLSGVPDAPGRARRLFLAKEGARLGGPLARTSFVPGADEGPVVHCKLSLANGAVEPADVSALERSARLEVASVVAALARLWPGVRLVHVAACVGVRTGDRTRGAAVLSAADVLGAVRHDDDIALGAWAIEEWTGTGRPQMQLLAEGATFGIPAGALEAGPGLWVAGRGLSADATAIASARAIGTCLATGWAAGRLAAGHVSGQARDATVAIVAAAQVRPG